MRPHRLAQGRVRLERVERRLERERDGIALLLLGQLVDEAVHGRRRLEPALDPVEAGEEQGRGREVHVGRAVREPQLDARRAAALGRHAHEPEAVVVAPAGPRRDELVRVDAAVRVHGRVEERHQRRRVRDHARDEVPQQLRAALVARAVGERVGAVGAAQREVEVEARARVAVERLAHERRQQALPRRQVLDGGLEAERAVGGVEGVRVREVDLPLAHAVLVRRTRHAEAGVVEREQHAIEHAARIGVVAHRVDVRRVLHVARPAARRGLAALEQVELELGPHHRRQPARLEARDRPLERRRADRRRRARRRRTGRPGTTRPRATTGAGRASPGAASRGCRGSRARTPRRRCGAGRRWRSPCRTPSRAPTRSRRRTRSARPCPAARRADRDR